MQLERFVRIVLTLGLACLASGCGATKSDAEVKTSNEAVAKIHAARHKGIVKDLEQAKVGAQRSGNTRRGRGGQ